MITESMAGRHASQVRGQLWQVPALIAGIAALFVVWAIRPLWHDPGTRQLADDLALLRRCLETQSPDTCRALAVGEHLLDQAERFPDKAGEISFLLGTAYLRRTKEVSNEQLAELLAKAREHLTLATNVQVPTADQPKLTYRLARIRYLMNDDPSAVVAMVAGVSESAIDDPFEHYEMMTQLHLRMNPPNLQAALAANAKQLALPADGEDLLAPARLVRGELLLRLNQRDEARKVLARIRPTSLESAYVRARLLRAQSSQQDRQWVEAAGLWEEILKDTKHPAPRPGRIKYYLGLCYRRLDRSRDAVRLWESTLSADPESSQAAALGLADLHLQTTNAAPALEWFERALREVKAPTGYQNTLIDAGELRKLAEEGTRKFIGVGDFARARRLVELYEPLAADASRQLYAEVSQRWGEDCEKRAAQAPGNTANRLLDEAAQHFRDAATAYASLAAGQPPQPQYLWLAGTVFLRGKDYTKAAESLRRFLQVETEPARLGVGWYTLAEVFRALNDEPAARDAYLKCIEYPSAFAFRARYQLAAADIAAARKANDRAKLEDATQALEHNLELMRFAPDDEAYEQTLLALAELFVERGNVRLAVIRLQEVLNRYPGTARQLSIRFQLADCYRRLAAQEEQASKTSAILPNEPQSQLPQQRRRWLQSAVANYQKIIDDLSARAAGGPLPNAEEAILRQALGSAAECHFEQGQFADAISYYEELAVRSPNQAEAIKALKQSVRCYWFLAGSANESHRAFFKGKALETIQRVRAMLKELPDSVFGEQSGLLSRAEEDRWVEWAWKQ